MKIKNCRECGHIFEYIAGPQVCPSCYKANEKKFKEVRDFIYDHENATISIVSEACDVSERQLRQWVREERLELKSASISGVTCESCGRPITTGRFCNKCKALTIKELTDASKRGYAVQQQDEDIPKMRYLNKR